MPRANLFSSTTTVQLGEDGSDPFVGKFPVPKPHTIVDNGKEVTAYEGQIIPREDVIREYQYRGK
jgi:hypothetical protein